MILLLRFLDRQFADVLDKGLNKSEALGWTGTFMKQGIALFLLCLYEGKWNGKGIMDANRRNYYGECAAYIAALGEVRESMGEMGAKHSTTTPFRGNSLEK